MVSIISHNPQETARIGEGWGRHLKAGILIGLAGELGAGKTQMTKGIARGLGIKCQVFSPTFTLIHEAEDGRLPFFHVDLFRLNDWESIARSGLDAYLFQTRGIVVVEWIDRCFGKAGAQAFADWRGGQFRFVQMQILSKNQRRIVYEDFGD